MPGVNGIVSLQDGRYALLCGYCEFEGNAQPQLASWDWEEIEVLANEHLRLAHRFLPLGWREGEIRGLGLGRRKAPMASEPANRPLRQRRSDA